VAESVSEAVGDRVKTAIDAIGITSGASAVPSVKRKLPNLPEGDPLGVPQFVVSVEGEGPTIYLDVEKKIRAYPVAVTIVTATGAKAADDATVRQWRDQIDAALDTRAAFTTLPGFNDVSAAGRAPFDVSALPKDWNYSVQVFTVEVIEART